MSRVQLTGDVHLSKVLETMKRGEQGRVVRPALRAGAKIVQKEVERTTPVRTGRLKRGRVKVRAMKRSRRRLAGINVQLPDRQTLGIPSDDRWYYPAIVEYMPGHGWVRRAAETKESEVGREVVKVMRDKIMELAGK